MAADPVTAVANVVDDATKLVLQKDNQANTPAAVDAKEASDVQKYKDAVRAALEKGDLEEIRRLCAS